MERIVEYELVINVDPSRVLKRVNDLISKNDGWKPLGGCAITGTVQAIQYAQAMVGVETKGPLVA